MVVIKKEDVKRDRYFIKEIIAILITISDLNDILLVSEILFDYYLFLSKINLLLYSYFI